MLSTLKIGRPGKHSTGLPNWSVGLNNKSYVARFGNVAHRCFRSVIWPTSGSKFEATLNVGCMHATTQCYNDPVSDFIILMSIPYQMKQDLGFLKITEVSSREVLDGLLERNFKSFN